MIQHMGTVLKLSIVFYRDNPIFQLNLKQVRIHFWSSFLHSVNFN
jgi:hypothetical protein